MADTSYLIFLSIVVFLTAVFVINLLRKGNIKLIHTLYFCLAGLTIIWMLALISINFIPRGNDLAEYIVDSITNVAVFIPVIMLLISLVFIKGWSRLPKTSLLLFVMPTLTFIMVWTNPLHHFYYTHFSLNISEVEFGWYFYIHSVYSYLCILYSAVALMVFAISNRSTLYLRQSLLLAVSNLIPLTVNILATTKIMPLTILSTPLSYDIGVLLCHGIAIFYLHLLDIKPIAVKTVLNWISDCYLVISSQGIVVNYNQAFADVFGKLFLIHENMYLGDCLKNKDAANNPVVYTLLNSIESCREAKSTISYEQSLAFRQKNENIKKYYMIDITPLFSDESIVGFVIFFKDVTKLKESMQRLQNSQARLMEHERLAFLGQTVGGIAHNLKTPIMSISGSATSVENLIEESLASIGDEDVTDEDFREIFGEMKMWVLRIREACAYMSDIITAVKGQAANLNTDEISDFTIDDMLKRVNLLLRHELISNNCTIKLENTAGLPVIIRGDINSMVQVINNLVGNSIDAMKSKGGGQIEIAIETDYTDNTLRILVKDRGPGISEDVKDRLFKQMVTTKGAFGNGLGLFISNSIIKVKFDGSMWFTDNPGGGTIFGVVIPLDCVTVGIPAQEVRPV